jgi:RNA polymerase sigma-70 factor, ECF subfamily
MLLDRSRVDDVLQEAYIKAYRKLPATFANEAHELAWLYRVLYRCCVDELRRGRRSREDSTPEVVHLAVVDDAFERTVAEEAWLSLSDRDRAVLLLVDVAGFDYAAASRLLRAPRGTVASRLSAARKHLREAVRDD